MKNMRFKFFLMIVCPHTLEPPLIWSGKDKDIKQTIDMLYGIAFLSFLPVKFTDDEIKLLIVHDVFTFLKRAVS